MALKYDRVKYRSESLLGKWFNYLSGDSRLLKKFLSDYPVYVPPHPSEAGKLSLAQANENFQFFENEKSSRLQLIVELLKKFELALDYQKPQEQTLLQLDAWAYQQWASIYHKSIDKVGVYRFDLTGYDGQIRSFLFDMAILLGECYLSLNSIARWSIDTKDKSSETFNRVVVSVPAPTDGSESVARLLDIETHVFFHYRSQCKSKLSILTDQKIGRVLSEPVLALLKK